MRIKELPAKIKYTQTQDPSYRTTEVSILSRSRVAKIIEVKVEVEIFVFYYNHGPKGICVDKLSKKF